MQIISFSSSLLFSFLSCHRIFGLEILHQIKLSSIVNCSLQIRLITVNSFRCTLLFYIELTFSSFFSVKWMWRCFFFIFGQFLFALRFSCKYIVTLRKWLKNSKTPIALLPPIVASADQFHSYEPIKIHHCTFCSRVGNRIDELLNLRSRTLHFFLSLVLNCDQRRAYLN